MHAYTYILTIVTNGTYSYTRAQTHSGSFTHRRRSRTGSVQNDKFEFKTLSTAWTNVFAEETSIHPCWEPASKTALPPGQTRTHRSLRFCFHCRRHVMCFHATNVTNTKHIATPYMPQWRAHISTGLQSNELRFTIHIQRT